MSEKKTRFRYEAAQVLVGKIAILAASMVSSIYFSRMLQAQGKGELAVVTAITGIFAQFSNLGLHSAHTYYVSKDRSLQGKAEGNILILFVITLLVAAASYPVLVLNQALVKIPPYLTAMALMGFVVSLSLLMQENLFLAIGDLREYNVLQILGILLNIVLAVIASIWLKVDVYLVATLYAITPALVLAFSWFDRNMVRPKVSLPFFFRVMPYGMGSYVSCLTTYLLLRTDILMLNYFLEKTEVGLYSQAVALSDMLYMFSSSVSAVLFPKLASFETVEQKAAMMGRVMKVMTPVILAAAAGLGVFARIIVLLLYGDGYLGAVPLVRALLISSVAWGLSGFAFNFFASESKFSEAIFVPLIGCILNIGMNYFLIPKMHNMGAAIASDVSYVFVAVVMFCCVHRYIGKAKGRKKGIWKKL